MTTLRRALITQALEVIERDGLAALKSAGSSTHSRSFCVELPGFRQIVDREAAEGGLRLKHGCSPERIVSSLPYKHSGRYELNCERVESCDHRRSGSSHGHP
jgi:hypothetical protein